MPTMKPPLFLYPFVAASAVILLCGVTAIHAQDNQTGEKVLSEEEAQKAFMENVESLGWQRDGVGKLKSEAEISIPPGYRFTGTDGTQKMMTAFGNLKTDREYGEGNVTVMDSLLSSTATYC